MNKGYKNIQVICDDTDVFVLLVNYHHVNKWKNDVLLTSLDESNKPISIKLTASKHASFASSLLAMHVLSGCDTVPMMCGIGKIGALNVIKKNPNILSSLGDLCAPISDVIDEGKSFVARCYGFNDCKDMSDLRYIVPFFKSAIWWCLNNVHLNSIIYKLKKETIKFLY